MEENEIKIGTQTWTTKNLDLSTYKNGDVIPQVQDEEEWANLTTGAWCYYENESDNGTTYGKLYNWFAVNDPRGLAPTGFHIPTDEEWTTLTNYLGGEIEAGDKMKSTTGWDEDGNGTNTSGFAGLPGGCRNSHNSFENIGEDSSWWSSSELNTTSAWNHYMRSYFGSVLRSNSQKQNGFSVRCLRD
jgi:uncharacterized protein (TIGR02145 family)